MFPDIFSLLKLFVMFIKEVVCNSPEFKAEVKRNRHELVQLLSCMVLFIAVVVMAERYIVIQTKITLLERDLQDERAAHVACKTTNSGVLDDLMRRHALEIQVATLKGKVECRPADQK